MRSSKLPEFHPAFYRTSTQVILLALACLAAGLLVLKAPAQRDAGQPEAGACGAILTEVKPFHNSSALVDTKRPGSATTATQAKPWKLPLRANFTVPDVAPPGGGLAFYAKPTEQEIFAARIFTEPLVPIGARPTAEQNIALAAALRGYAARAGPDDFTALTGCLKKHPTSPWCAALQTNLGIESYNTGHYPGTMESWKAAWELARNATEPKARGIADRAAGELASMYARLGRIWNWGPCSSPWRAGYSPARPPNASRRHAKAFG